MFNSPINNTLTVYLGVFAVSNIRDLIIMIDPVSEFSEKYSLAILAAVFPTYSYLITS